MPQMFDPRDGRAPGARAHTARALGPYETAYDTRRGYTERAEPAERPARHDADEVWHGRARDER